MTYLTQELRLGLTENYLKAYIENIPVRYKVAKPFEKQVNEMVIKSQT